MPGLDASAGHPHGESVRIMVAAIAFFRHRRAAELAAPDDQRFVQQPPRFEVLEEAGDGLIHRAAGFGVIALDVGVGVPLASRRHNRSGRTARRARPGGGPASRVGRWSRPPGRPGHRGRVFRQSRATGRRPRGLGLHAKRQLVALDPGVELGLVGRATRDDGD